MLKTGILVAFALFTAAPQQPEPPAPTSPEPSISDLKRRRDQVQMLEGVLTGAVRLGAQDLSRRMQSADPSLLMTTGTARARGFILEGYGVFFDVDIPTLRTSVLWAFRTMDRGLQVGNALDSLRAYVQTIRDPASRANLEQALKRVEYEVGPVQPPRDSALAQQSPPAGMIQGAAVAADTAADPASTPALPENPDTAYTDAVKNALIEAMLDYSAPMGLGPDEWLTVAARDSEGPMLPGEIYDPSTIVIRVKGSDIAAYNARRDDRATREEIRKRVTAEVRVF
jgi:hypothetical protein